MTTEIQILGVHIDAGYATFIKAADGTQIVGGTLSEGQFRYIASVLDDGRTVTAEVSTVGEYNYITGFKVS